MRTLLFIDDHPLYREGLQRSLRAAMPDLVVRTSPGYRATLDMRADLADVDLCLADYRLPDGDGVSLLTEIKRIAPSIAIGLLCAEPSASLAMRVRALGGVACLSKDRDTAGLVDALDTLFDGGEVFDQQTIPGSGSLSMRRRELLVLAGEGLLDKQIGDRLSITESTVRNHWQHIFSQLGVGNRTEAVTKAIRLGLI